MLRRAALLVCSVALLAACGGAAGGKGTATLWVTRDQGAKVLLVRTVPAGLTAMQALEREAEIKTRYGGRFVESIGGIRGSLSKRWDWFYFVNGVEADRSAVEYRLHPGDVEWWDYRSWQERLEQPVVVGAFPEPFLHGYGGKSRPAAVRYEGSKLRAIGYALANLVRARSVAPLGTAVSPEANLLIVVPRSVRFSARLREGGGAGSPVVFRISAEDAKRLVKDPASARYRYEGLK